MNMQEIMALKQDYKVFIKNKTVTIIGHNQ